MSLNVYNYGWDPYNLGALRKLTLFYFDGIICIFVRMNWWYTAEMLRGSLSFKLSCSNGRYSSVCLRLKSLFDYDGNKKSAIQTLPE